MKKIGLAVGLALAMTTLVVGWSAWRGDQAVRGASPLAQASYGDVVINEVGWMGTAANPADEWIELYNTTGHPITLTGWHLADDDYMEVTLSGVIPAGGYYLLERTDDTAIADIVADWTGSFGSGGLSNSGEVLTLTNQVGTVVDTANGDGGAWPAGIASPDYCSMERVDPYAPDTGANWDTNDRLTRNGHDAGGSPINGTPKNRNSAASPAADLVAFKDGPASAEPGDRVTFTLGLRNAGNIPAAALLVTDTLPSGVAFVTQTSSFTFSQPAANRLVWTADALPVSTTFSLMTIVAAIDAEQTEAVCNVVTATSGITEALVANNTARLTTALSLAAPELSLVKTGPDAITPGFTFSSRIVLSNTGAITAAGVVVTDVLPSGLSFVSQTSFLTFTQPAADTLAWRVGALPTGVRYYISLTLRSADTLTGTVTNVVTATDEAGHTRNATWSADIVPTVRLYALHPWALYSDDESVALINLGVTTATLTGWGLSDNADASKVTLPEARLSPGEIIWLADDADSFSSSFGFAPDFALSGVTHTVPLLTGTWPGFANYGDEGLLFDDGGRLVDTLVYGNGLTTTTGWNGAAVPYPRSGWGSGQILYRKLDQATGRPVPEADAVADWAQANDDEINGKKVRFPGWDLKEFFFPAQITQTATLTVWVAPDGLYEGVVGVLQEAQSSILIEGYTFDNPDLVGVITNLLAVRPNLAVTVLLEGRKDASVMWACERMVDAGAEIYFMHSDDDSPVKIYDRYALQHAKFVIVDRRWVLIGSENFSPDGMPADPKADGTWGHRGVYLGTDAPGVVARAQAIFDRDLDTAHSDIVPWGSHGYTVTTVFTPTFANWVTYTARFSQPLVLTDEFYFEVVQSPENSLRDRDALLGLLARAGSDDTILIEQLYERQFWGDGTPDDPNPRLEAYVEAARRGATVRLLLDGRYDYDGDNRATADTVNHIAQSEGLDLEARWGNPTGESVHNKMVLARIAGRGYVHVGSINGSEASSKANRELALQVQSDEAYEFLKTVFDYDWQASWPSSPHLTHVYLPLVMQGYVPPADHLVISELLYNPAGLYDERNEWIEIYNPTVITVTLTGYRLSDGSSYGDGTAVFPPGAKIPAGGVVVVAQRADTFGLTYGFHPDFELKESDPAVPNMTPLNSGIFWGNAGDEAILRDATGADVDVVVYGSGNYPGVTPHPGVGGGNSLERKPADRDTGDCSADFWERYTPNPGQVTLD